MNAAVVILTQRKKLKLLMQCLQALQRNMLQRFPYPVVICHEGDFNGQVQKGLARICPTIHFRRVDIRPPKHIRQLPRGNWAEYPRFGVGYRNMCRFFSLGLYPNIRDLDYYMRLDDDSVIQTEIGYDPFLFMQENGKDYAWRAIAGETASVVVGLKELLEQHDPVFKGININPMFYNNFHIARPSLWLESPCKEALAAIDASDGFYIGRWGDAPVQTLLVRAYVPEERRHAFDDFRYKHGKHIFMKGMLDSNHARRRRKG